MALSALLVPPSNEEHGGSIGCGSTDNSGSNSSGRLHSGRALLVLGAGADDPAVGGAGGGGGGVARSRCF